MRFDVITLFPELFAPHLASGVTRRAFSEGKVDVRLWPLRDHAEGNYRRVDDRPFGGGPGMVMLADPLHRCLQAVHADRGAGHAAPVVLFTPTGRALDQRTVERLGRGPGAVLLCGRYEGVDQRIIDRFVDEELSLGDFVLSGGEIPALALLDAVARLQDGVLNDSRSAEQDSFAGDGLLDHPHYSRPEQWQIGDEMLSVPEVLLGGHHARIARWRRDRALELTLRRRPELIDGARARGRLDAEDERFLKTLKL